MSFVVSAKMQQKILQRVREVGSYQMRKRGTAFSTTDKDDLSPVTEIDLHSHQELKKLLAEISPTIPLLSEESTDKFDFIIADTKVFWCIDPLDGTRDYIEGTPHFAINLALFEHGQVTWGMIHHPASEETLVADRRRAEVCLIDARDQQTRLEIPFQTEQIEHVLTSARIAMDSGRHEQIKLVVPHLSDTATIVPISSSFKFIMLLKRQAEAYIRKAPCMLWDVAPGFLAAELAGFTILHLASRESFVWPTHALDPVASFGMFVPQSFDAL